MSKRSIYVDCEFIQGIIVVYPVFVRRTQVQAKKLEYCNALPTSRKSHRRHGLIDKLRVAV